MALTARDIGSAVGFRGATVEVAVLFRWHELTVEILRPGRMVRVGVDVVVGELLCSGVVPEGTLVFNFVELGVGLAVRELAILEFLTESRIGGGEHRQGRGSRRQPVRLGEHVV